MLSKGSGGCFPKGIFWNYVSSCTFPANQYGILTRDFGWVWYVKQQTAGHGFSTPDCHAVRCSLSLTVMNLKGREWGGHISQLPGDEVGVFKQPQGSHIPWLDFAFLYFLRLCQDLSVEFWTWGWRSCPKGLLQIEPRHLWTWMWKISQLYFH